MKKTLFIILLLAALILIIYFATQKTNKIYEPYENPRPRVQEVWPDQPNYQVEPGKDKG